MNYNNLNRREWLKKGALAMGALALSPQDLWSKTVDVAREQNQRFLFPSHTNFNEFTPPRFPDLSTVKARLVWNENPYGPSKKAVRAFQDSVLTGNHYSWDSLSKLVDKIAAKEGVSSKQVMMGPGSSDLLEKTAMVLFQNGGNVVSADPSYMSLVSVARAAGGKWKAVKLTNDYQHDLAAMEKAIDRDTRLVYITNPNNPTATTTEASTLLEFCRRVSKKVPVFVDEAYLELSETGLKGSMAPLVAEGSNVFVARTFSKIHGMAGLRVGYMLGNEKSLEEINEVTRGGMGITGPSILAASESMDDLEHLEFCKGKIEEARGYMKDYLDRRRMSYLPSETNFIIFPIEMEGDAFLEEIYKRKIVVRAFKFWDTNWCRVSMGKMDEMKLFTQALDEILL